MQNIYGINEYYQLKFSIFDDLERVMAVHDMILCLINYVSCV